MYLIKLFCFEHVQETLKIKQTKNKSLKKWVLKDDKHSPENLMEIHAGFLC